MSDAISRQSVIDALEQGFKDTTNGLDKLSPTRGLIKAVTGIYKCYIEQLPPAQPEIIRCRECKFASGDSRICMKFDHSPIGELDFCSFAERREVTT